MGSNTPPNILILHTDQQRFDTIQALGAAHVQSPNLDRLVRRGQSFSRAYSSCPVCMPARHDLLTGASARHHGYWTNSNAFIADYGLATFPRLLTEAGYQTLSVGKMHHNPPREHHGWAHMFLMEELPDRIEDDAYLQHLSAQGYGQVRCQHGVRPLFYHTPQVSQVPEQHHGSAWVADQTIELLRRQRDCPFCILASWVGPHPPYYVPQPYLDLYRDVPLPEPCPLPPGGERTFVPSPENPEPGSLRLRRIREAYFAACTLIDAHIGRILDVMEEESLLDNTLIIFMSDHGEMLGDRGGYQKHFPYEGSSHIPLIVAGPGIEASSTCHSPVTTWDVAATILDAAGVPWPESHPLVGSSLLDVASADTDRPVHIHFGRGRIRYVAALAGSWKFVHFYNGGAEELYNLDDDPWEQHNLLAADGPNPEVLDVARRLRQTTLDFERRHGDPERVNQDGFVDLPYDPPQRHMASLYPPWSSFQYPHWMEEMTERDRKAIIAQMREAMRSAVADTCHEPEWRQHAIDEWIKRGGDAGALQRVFRDVDRGAKS